MSSSRHAAYSLNYQGQVAQGQTRPSSANLANRAPSYQINTNPVTTKTSDGGYAKNNSGTANFFNRGVVPTAPAATPIINLSGYQSASTSNQRPSSAGASRASAPANTTYSGVPNGAPVFPAAIPVPQQNAYRAPSVTPIQVSFPSRPKSAGTVRSTTESAAIPTDYMGTHAHQYQYNRSTNTGVNAMFMNVTPNVIPTTTAQNTFADTWNSSYKLHYGYSAKTGIQATMAAPAPSTIASTSGSGTGTLDASKEFSTVPSTAAATARPSSRIRAAINQGQQMNGKDVPIEPKETDDTNIGVEYNTEIVEDNDNDDEMDGKKISTSRLSAPEVSMTTPSHSLVIADGVDARNSSLYTEVYEDQNIGLSTVPNRFCSIAEAHELKKILLLAKGSRGGIVPSSTTVMDMYMVGKVIGVGSYGKVRAAWHRLSGGKIAIKTYDKAKLTDPAHWKRVHSEIKIMEQISHPRIARMYEAVETPKRMHLIIECLDGGNLCSYVKAKKRLSEEESKRIFFQLAQAIEHLHVLGVSHRDIKLENVLFDNNKNIKLIDFGFSTVCQAGKKLKIFCGTPSYMAPEIVRRLEYEGKPVDIWSMGILLYALLCGCFPFRAKSYPDLYRRIARGTFAIPEEFSPAVKDLLRQLLTVDVTQRINAQATMRHPWLASQLVASPDIPKLRRETAILISDKPDDDLDDATLDEIAKFGIGRDEMMRQVLTKTHSALSTLYYLLLDHLLTVRRQYRKGANPTTKQGTSSASGNQLNIVMPSANAISSSGAASNRPSSAGAVPKYMQSTQSKEIRDTIVIGTNPQATSGGGDGYARPRSASAGRPSQDASNRPSSGAYAGRMRINII